MRARCRRRGRGLHPGGPATEPDVDPIARSAELLARRDVLLVLDGCEHVPSGAAATAAALLGRRGVSILVTSQVALGVAGEVVVPLAPLAPPDRAPTAPPSAPRRPSPCWRAASTTSASPSPTTTGCGWPPSYGRSTACPSPSRWPRPPPARSRSTALARMFAADTSSVLDAEPSAGSGRRLALGAALDAACERLDPEAARLHAVVSGSPAAFDADVAGAAADVDEGAAGAALGRLADASLVVVDARGRHRFRLLQPVRAHAATQLDAADGPRSTGGSPTGR